MNGHVSDIKAWLKLKLIASTQLSLLLEMKVGGLADILLPVFVSQSYRERSFGSDCYSSGFAEAIPMKKRKATSSLFSGRGLEIRGHASSRLDLGCVVWVQPHDEVQRCLRPVQV